MKKHVFKIENVCLKIAMRAMQKPTHILFSIKNGFIDYLELSWKKLIKNFDDVLSSEIAQTKLFNSSLFNEMFVSR